VIAASNVDLDAAVADKRFRDDLYYRLNVLPLRMPSLSERRDDVPALVTFFRDAAAKRHRLARLEPSNDAVRAAELAEWPGNVRQLANAVEAALIRACGAGAPRIDKQHLFPATPGGSCPAEPLTFQEGTRRFQAAFVREALEAADWNVAQVAQRLDVARSHLYTLIRVFDLKRP
jgi:DNA-binding NtrC family response regulator